VSWQRELRAEAGNLHAALQWMDGRGDPETQLRLALAAHYLAVHRGGLAEVRTWLERILPQLNATSRLSATGFAALGWESLLLRDTHAAAAAGAKSMAAAEAAQDEVGAGYGAWIYATALDDLGETETAARLYDRVVTIGRRAARNGDPVGARLAVDGLGQLAFLAERRGDLDEAAEMYAEAVGFGRSHEVDPTHWSSVLLSLSVIARKRGDDHRAAQLLSEALPLFSDRGNLRRLAGSIAEVAQCALTLKRPGDAARLLGAAAAIDEQTGIPASPEDTAERERLVAIVRAELSKEAYEAAMVEGRAMTTQFAVAKALALTEELAADRPRTGTIQTAVRPT
jgi:tetratricopeptide (TPR) repeat protein